MWPEITTPIKRVAGSSGAVTVPVGAKILHIAAHSTGAGTMAIWDQDGGTCTLPLPASSGWFYYNPQHLATVVQHTGHQVVTFTGTDAYLVEYTSNVGF